MSNLGRVLRGAQDGAATVDSWVAAVDTIRTQRAVVEKLAESKPIYGFNTLLGHLDHLAQRDLQSTLLDAHLVGVVSMSSGAALNLVTATKLEQLHRGGSGIHPDTYRMVLHTAFDRDALYPGAWSASYGSGDVVPGAWWLKCVLDRNGLTSDDLHPGDVIALINGNYMSTAKGIDVLLGGIAVTARIVGALRTLARVDRRAPLPGWAAAVAETIPEASTSNPQTSVATRDCRPVLTMAVRETDHLADALVARLDTFSGNPEFIVDDISTGSDLSQSSFLDASLTAALGAYATYLRFASAAVVAAFHHHLRTTEPGSVGEQIASVQPPKVATATLIELDRMIDRPVFFLQESEGIEDLGDGSLLTANSVAAGLEIAGDVLDVCGVAPDADGEAVRLIADHLDIDASAVAARSIERW